MQNCIGKILAIAAIHIPLLLLSCKSSDNIQGVPDGDTGTENGPVRYLDEVFSVVTVNSNLRYSRATDENGERPFLMLDLYAPAGDSLATRPAIVLIHGGGFRAGDKADPAMAFYANGFAKRGYVVASINYRLTSKTISGEDDPAFLCEILPEAQSDAQAAVRWLRRNATTYGIDDARILIAGSSAGAITALAVTYNYEENADDGATVPAPARAPECLNNAARLFDPNGSHAGFSSRVIGASSIAGALLEDATVRDATGQPVLAGQMQPGDPPVVFFHGTADSTVPYQYALRLQARAQATGVAHEFISYPNAEHFLHELFGQDILDRTVKFFFEKVITPTGGGAQQITLASVFRK